MKILIAGDLLPQECNENLFLSGNVETLFGAEILKIFWETDLCLTNLEGSLTEETIPISKSEPALKASGRIVPFLEAILREIYKHLRINVI